MVNSSSFRFIILPEIKKLSLRFALSEVKADSIIKKQSTVAESIGL